MVRHGIHGPTWHSWSDTAFMVQRIKIYAGYVAIACRFRYIRRLCGRGIWIESLPEAMRVWHMSQDPAEGYESMACGSKAGSMAMTAFLNRLS